MFELLSVPHELGHSFTLEFFDVLVLPPEVHGDSVFEGSELERLIGSLFVDLLVELVFSVINFLQDVLLSFDSGCNFPIEAVLQTYY